jgi:glycosyltransferase involved in cell wall biosynthesis
MAEISGFTILRNGVKYDYPFVESIKSILPIVREMVVAVGKSEDETLKAVKAIRSDKIRILKTVWDMKNNVKGSEFARQTNVALRECKYPWAFYLQADEVVHENDLETIINTVNKGNDDPQVDAFSFRYIHFESCYDYYNPFRYKRAVRIVRNIPDIVSIKDAAEFGKTDRSRLRVSESGARIFHYGWVKSPKVMLEKMKSFEKFWHENDYVENKYAGQDEYDFRMLDVAKRFKGAHPHIMQGRIKEWNLILPKKVPRRPLIFRKMTWHIYLRKWGIVKKEWF